MKAYFLCELGNQKIHVACFIAVVWNQTYNIQGMPVLNTYCNQLDVMVLSMAPNTMSYT